MASITISRAIRPIASNRMTPSTGTLIPASYGTVPSVCAAVGGKEAPALYFGKTKINNNFDIVDAVGERDGKGMTATLFAKGGDEYIRVSTSVPKPDGIGRAVGTVLAGPALESIKGGKAYYGEVPVLGTPYITGYEPIKDSSGAQIGVYYVGYKK